VALAWSAPLWAGERDGVGVSVRKGEDRSLDMVFRLGKLLEEAPKARHKSSALTIPTAELVSNLSRSLVRESLGVEVMLQDGGKALSVKVPEGDDLNARLDSLTLEIREAGRREDRYGFHARASYRPNDPGRPTVCLIHGINSSSYSFIHLLEPLEKAGFGIVVYDFPYNTDLDKLADRFADEWSAFRAGTADKRPWAITTHSMGALLARSYIEGDRYGDDVSRLVMLGPPNRGAAMARAQGILQLIERAQGVDPAEAGAIAGAATKLGEAAEDLTLGSQFLANLNARPRRPGVAYHILAGSKGFLTREARAEIDRQYGELRKKSGLLGGLLLATLPDLPAILDELSEETGDGVVSLESARLEGVGDVEVIPVNHVELIRGPLLYPDSGPVACLPFVLDRLAEERPKP
jgi:pimeloyl-ACP methyl ester carboxylesterase